MSEDQNPQDDGARQHLEQIRELLFGEEQRSTKKRLKKTESRLEGELSALAERLQARLVELDAQAREGRAALAERLDALRAHGETVEQETGESLTALSRSLERLGERQTQQLQELRDELHAAMRDLGQRVERSLEVLDARKTDRELLARLLADVAKGLAQAEPSGAPSTTPDAPDADRRR